MKYILLILLFTSCATSTTFITRSVSELTYNNDTHIVICKTQRRAKTVQKRIKKRCSEPLRYYNVLELTQEQIECKHVLFNKEYGFLNKYEQTQLHEK